MPPIISVEHLGKRYLIGRGAGPRDRYQTLRDTARHTLSRLYKKPFELFGRSSHSSDAGMDEFWALKDVSFDVESGQVVGIIGRNGAGKSTLLKVLSRITEPSEGRVTLRGRIASLLEVGTGFHPELTGRENIYLNGSILGMTRTEIRRQFDEIVAFSEIEKFLDTPVKRYSSGMYVRLAFAVAAHLEPEILVVDEVLAVGDAAFQKKCLGKMQDVSQGGRTVLFVSHHMAMIQNLCTRAIYLANGTVQQIGPTEEVVKTYLSHSADLFQATNDLSSALRPKWARPLICSARLLDDSLLSISEATLGEAFSIEMEVQLPPDFEVKQPVMGVTLRHSLRDCVGGVNTRMTGSTFPSVRGGRFRFRCDLAEVPLLQGDYSCDLWLGDGPSNIDVVESGLHFTVRETDLYGTGQIPFAHMGVIYLKPQWSLEPQHDADSFRDERRAPPAELISATHQLPESGTTST